jgi:hypothetical protein
MAAKTGCAWAEKWKSTRTRHGPCLQSTQTALRLLLLLGHTAGNSYWD